MDFGLFSNDRRPSRRLGIAWQLDIDEIVVADKLGFRYAWISEHEAVADLIIMRAASLTKQILLGSAVRLIPIYHPIQVAVDAASCDQLTNGRYMLGVGGGFRPDKMIARGINPETLRERIKESTDLILRLFKSKEPFDYEGCFWSGKNMQVGIPFVQDPHPPIAVAVARTLQSAIDAGRNNLMIITSDFIQASKLRQFGDALEEGQSLGGFPQNRRHLHTCRVVYVAHSDTAARDELRASYSETIRWEVANTPWHQKERIPPGGTFDDITFDYLCDSGNLFVGSPETVRQQIENLYKETGGFGALNFHAGRDYATPERVAASLRLFSSEVAPKLKHLTPVCRTGEDL
jgi:alkanesulfonate monooxygenase SsuD/methylene tetrahydromethanopterin reductase-like flavin-dependent oxidoreductase (luciferase family)